jgi:endonuclease-8
MPEGDTILWAASRMRPVLQGQVPDAVRMPVGPPGALRGSPGRDRWPQRLAGRRVERIDTHGKNLFVLFEGDLVLHSHLKMTGAWGVYPPGRRWHRSPSRAWIVLAREGTEVVQFDGPVLELMTAGRSRFHQRLAGLGPDVLATQFDAARFLARLHQDDRTRPVGDALLDQRNVAGIGNIWKSEGCWEAKVDPWRALGSVSDADVMRIIELVRPRMLMSGTRGPRFIRPRVYRLAGRPCPRCGTPINSQLQGDGGRMTYWCPGCQG